MFYGFKQSPSYAFRLKLFNFGFQDFASKYKSSKDNIKMIFEALSTYSGHDLRMDKVKYEFLPDMKSFADLKTGIELRVIKWK